MPISAPSVQEDDSIVHRRPGSNPVVVRRFDARRDSWERLTVLLHRAFAPLAGIGVHCRCADQDTSITRERALDGTCFVSVSDGRIVGTMTLELHDPDSPCGHYRRHGVAALHQFAVEPSYQRKGVGRAMLAFAGRRAAAQGSTQLALDTPFAADSLLAYYRSLGFTLVDVVQFPGRGYDSAVFSRPTLEGWPASALTRRTCSSRVRR